MTTLVSLQLGYKDTAWFNANPTLVLKSGQHVYLSDGTGDFSEAYVIGDGTTQLSSLPWRGVKEPKLREEFTIPSVANSSVTLSYIPVFVWGVYLNGVFLITTEYSIISGVLTIFSATGGDLAIVYSHNNVVPPVAQTLYYLRKVSENNIFPPMDGVNAVEFEGNLKIAMGWNPALVPDPDYPLLPFPSAPDSNYTFDTTNEGRDSNWTQGADIPWFPTHGQGLATRADGKIWFWGLSGQSDNQSSSAVLTYDSVNGWVTVSNDWTLGLRVSHCSFLHNDYMYTFGGQDTYGAGAVAFNDMWRSNDGVTWDFVCTLPEPFMSGSTAWTDKNEHIFITAGGKLDNGAFNYSSLVTKIYRSTDQGFTFSFYANLPTAMQGIWADAFYWDDKAWFICGTKNGSNQPGIFVSEDNFLNASLFSIKMPPRHLTARAIVNNHAHIICGNLWNDHWLIEQITYPIVMDPDVKDWYERLYPADRPTTPVLTARNNFVLGLKSSTSLDGVNSNWDCLDWLHVFSGCENEAQALQPMKTSNQSFLNGLTKIGNPTINFNGVAGNGIPGSATGLNTNWNSFLHADKFQFDSASIFLYSLSTTIEDSNDFGCPRLFLAACQTNNQFYGAVNDTFEASTPAVNGKGYRGASRFDSTNRELVLNTSHVASTQISDPVAGYVCIGGSGPTLNNPSSKTYAANGIGNKHLDHDMVKSLLEAYMTEIGVSF